MIVIDTSIALKWVVKEAGHEAALSVFDIDQSRVAPDLLLAEASNVLRKKHRVGQVRSDQINAAIEALEAGISQFIPSSELVRDAMALAIELDHSSYDCFFLACAISRGILVSADDVFLRKCRASGYGKFVAGLAELQNGALARHTALLSLDNKALRSVTRLAPLVQKTFQALRSSPANAPLPGMSLLTTERAKLGEQTPAYRQLLDVLGSLSNEELCAILALGWLGRSYQKAQDWPELLDHALGMFDNDLAKHEHYFMAQMPNVETGLKKLQLSVSVFDSD